ncbi:hypothetical protein EG68_00571 [Paragonimus skrjabini miyazakii]|uniref:Uncharacterized protein n=1 Tax=Paragonimus skrjabini miyazakii TaxID=59628 RepID=A0A8S9Z9C2_9TREM|nr:hypothetical protein EG68_00571 [Paragonimus skrjabini miyazakii]
MQLNVANLLSLLRLTGILTLSSLISCARKQCFNLDQELAYCAQKHEVKMPANQLSGYSFGYGSLNETEYMCRTRWHILVFRCMRRRSEETCRHSEEERFRQLVWSISLDTIKFERAAAYMCHEHNLRILREHQYQCLMQQEKVAEQCTVHRNDTIREVVTALQNQSNKVSSNSNEYYALIKQTLTEYECKTLRTKLECLYTVLHNTCPPNAVRLIMNYFKETLPDGCTFSYEDRLLRHLKSTMSRPHALQRDNDESYPVRSSSLVGESLGQRLTITSKNGQSGTSMTSSLSRLHLGLRILSCLHVLYSWLL